MQCSGCRQEIDVARPDGVAVRTVVDPGSPGRPASVSILLGQVEVHRCVLCPDGQYR